MSPETLFHQNLKLPSFENHPTHHSLVVVAIGKDRYDDLNARSWEEVMRLNLSIPEDIFDALN